MDPAAQQPYRPAGRGPSVAGLYLAVLVAAAVLYGLTCQRGASWQDSGMFQFRALSGDLGYRGELGLALAHPLYILAGWALRFVPIGSFTWRLSFFSGLGMAVALANLSAIGVVLTGRRAASAAVVAMLALAHTPWWLATVAEVYTWSVAGFTAELWLLMSLLRRPGVGTLAALAFISGLGLCVHNFALLPLPVYLAIAVWLVWRRRLPAWSLALAAGTYLVGAGLYVGMAAAKAVETGSLLGAVRSALFGQYQSRVLGLGASSARLVANAALVAMNFLNVLLPLAVAGAWVLRRRVGGPVAAALAALTVIQGGFAVRYFVPDQFTFFLPTYAMVAVLAVVGFDAACGRGRRWRQTAWVAVAGSVLLMPLAYGLGPVAVRRWAPRAARPARGLPFRDEARYWLTPWKHNEDSTERFARAAFQQVEPGAVIVADPTAYYPLAVAQRLYGLGRGVRLCGGHEPWPLPHPDENLAAFLAASGGVVYVVSPQKGYCPGPLLRAGRFERADVLYRLLPAATGPAGVPADEGRSP